MDEAELVNQQLAYYRARAAEYDEWFLRQGRYDRGSVHRAEWNAEVALLETALRESLPSGEVLELACGTGLWTRHLTRNGRRVLAIDTSLEAILINRAPDAVFFGFWLSHVPPARFERFWETVRAALRPGGTALFVDSFASRPSPRPCTRAAAAIRPAVRDTAPDICSWPDRSPWRSCCSCPPA